MKLMLWVKARYRQAISPIILDITVTRQHRTTKDLIAYIKDPLSKESFTITTLEGTI